MELFDKNLLQSAEIMGTLFKALGENAPKMRFLQVDYKESGMDKNVSIAYCQNKGIDDKTMIGELLKAYAEQGKKIGFIMEMDKNGKPVTSLYSTDWYLKECAAETMKILHSRKGSGDRL
jgi:hypothetical protein